MKFFVTILAILVFIAIGWYSLPADFREKAMAFIGIAGRRDRQEIRQFVEDAILPEDPKERRAVLIGELKKNIEEIKTVTVSSKKINPPKNQGILSVAGQKTNTVPDELIKKSESIVKELENANFDIPIREKIIERVLEFVLPSKNTDESVVCKIEKKQ
ncbi:MAG: hypothetical protein HYW89_02305 [Candidatus Sungiibacteriota bacterium]|uniref:Uncharacterized protein n=1 Tax=Candidatus Sungiibacteriota bacterium TaxID=2750080 RepID=A0A7T5RKA3_9BACT|nr:MAG: hypothetical protein HYW89_02305 [Candidatus Sungbacteria bacterium]